MSIDLEAGKILSSVKPRRSAVPGNLVCYRGRVLSRGWTVWNCTTRSMPRDEVARLLAANPDDVEGLTLRGEMFMDAGKPAEAVADFRRAYRADKRSESHGRTREELRDALLAGLHDNFAAHRAMAGEVEPLLDDAAQRATYLRLMATGLHRAGDWRQAIEYYLKLADLEEAKPALEKVQRLVSRPPRRLGAGPAGHASQRRRRPGRRGNRPRPGTAFGRGQKGRGLRGPEAVPGLFRQSAPGGGGADGTAAAPDASGTNHGGRVAHGRGATRYWVPRQRPQGPGRLAGRHGPTQFSCQPRGAPLLGDAAACFRQLQRQFADVPCHAGLTSSQWLAVLPDGDALRQEVRRKAGTTYSWSAWPAGEVEASKPEPGANPFNRGPRFDMLLGGGDPFMGGGPFFSDCSLGLEYSQQQIVLRDGLGRPQKTIPLVQNGRAYFGGYNQNASPARSCGHLLLTFVGTKIQALDPREASGNSSPILWGQDLADTTTDNEGNMIFVNNGYDQNFRANPFGPVNARYVCYQRKRSIVAVDPLSGEPLWERQDIAPNSEVFGDEQYLFVISSGSEEASVYRATDGQLLGTRKLPRPNFRNSYYDGSERWGSAALSNAGFDFLGRWRPHVGTRRRQHRPGVDLVRSLASEGGLAVADVCLGGSCRGGRQRGGGRAGTGRTFCAGGPGRWPHDRRSALEVRPH